MGDTAAVAEWYEFGVAVIVGHAEATGAGSADGVEPTRRELSTITSRVTKARKALHASLETDTAFATLAWNAGLTVPEAEVLAIASVADADMACQQLVSRLQGDSSRNRLSLGLLRQLLGPDHRGPLCVTEGSNLRRCALVDVQALGAWANHVVAVEPNVIWALFGDDSPDPALPSDLHRWTAPEAGTAETRATFVVVNGSDRVRRWQAAALHTPTSQFICCREPETDQEWAAVVREATITGCGVIVDLVDSLGATGRRWIHRAHHLVWVVAASSGPPIDDLPTRRWLDVLADEAEPTDEEWERALGSDTPRAHRLTMDQLERIRRADPASGHDLDAAVRRLTSGKLETVTRRIRPSKSWDDIVLSEDRIATLRSVGERYRNGSEVYDKWGFAPTPSRGLVALFSGPSGTGKTLAAEIVAHDLGLDVFKLDLSAVVSKYIGETEKNLEQVFEAASAGNMVLFFDEADSLFGKRSEVKDARDRYANIEVSYMLQRLEVYDGLVIMATNFEKNIDDAFIRRIHVRVPFAMPEINEREAIWHHNLPRGAPVGDIDVPWLAKQFEISGAAIRNAAVQAAFLAAAERSEITMACAVRGVAHEFRKMGRLIKPGDFGDQFDLVAE